MRIAFGVVVALVVATSSLVAQGESRPAAAESRAAASRPSFTLYFVRHGESESNVRPLEPLSDEEKNKLTKRGVEQATKVAERLKSIAAAAVYASPAGRAQATALAITKARGGPIATTEADAGPLKDGVGADGQPFPAKARGAAWRKGVDVKPQDGESLEDVRNRSAALVRSLAERHAGGAAILVAHGEVCAALIAEAEGGTALERLLKTAIGNASVHLFDVTDGRLTYRGLLDAPASRAVEPKER